MESKKGSRTAPAIERDSFIEFSITHLKTGSTYRGYARPYEDDIALLIRDYLNGVLAAKQVYEQYAVFAVQRRLA